MALTAVNPIVLSTPSPQGLPLDQMLAEDAKTWKKGEFALLTSGTVTPLVATGSTAVYAIFASDQTSSTSTSTVYIRRLIPGTILAISEMNAGTPGLASAATIGTAYGARGLSNVSYLDVGTATGQFRVIGPASTHKAYQDAFEDMDATPGLVIVEFRGFVS